MPVTVRRLLQADVEAWAVMRQRLWTEQSLDAHRREIATLSSSDMDLTAYGAVTDSEHLIGFAEVTIRPYANGCTALPVPFLDGVWTDPNHRRQSVGRALISYIEAELARRGFTELCSDTDIANLISQHAHQSWGFQETERVVYFRKDLRKPAD